MNAIERTTHVIDATNQPPGRLASRIARLLMGKHKTDYQPHTDCGDIVTVEHVAALHITKQKQASKQYHRHSRYPGGLKTESAKELSNSEVLWRAVHKMLPKNRLRAKMIKRLTIQ